MTNDPERVRALLERHGYRIWCDDYGCAYECHGDELAGEAADDYAHDPATFQDACDAALAHFLNDRARDSARLKDLSRRDDFRDEWEDWGFGIRCDADPHASLSAWWLRVNGLEDPRQEATV